MLFVGLQIIFYSYFDKHESFRSKHNLYVFYSINYNVCVVMYRSFLHWSLILGYKTVNAFANLWLYRIREQNIQFGGWSIHHTVIIGLVNILPDKNRTALFFFPTKTIPRIRLQHLTIYLIKSLLKTILYTNNTLEWW